MKLKGVVKWFSESKGYGFITPDDGGEDIFVHFSGILGPGLKILVEGQGVDFELEGGIKVQAVHVIISTPLSGSLTSLDQEEEQKQATDDTNAIEEDQE